MGTPVATRPAYTPLRIEPTDHGRTRLVELAGPAGTGKTTLTRMLAEYRPEVRVADDIALRRPAHLATFVRTVPGLLALLLPHRNSRRFAWEEIKALAYVGGWPGVLTRQAESSRGTILLDQGPVFRLATLHAFGPELLRAPSARPWWSKTFQQWASALDLVFWLDAPNSVLEQRVNDRERWHMVKGKPEQEVWQFLERYRASYQYVLANLRAHNGPRVIAFDTGRMSLSEALDAILAETNLQADRD
jgi:thymidylate kinase